MRVKNFILSSTSAAVMALAATSASAQSQPATPPDPNAQAQESPGDPEAGVAQTDDAVQSATGADQADGEEIVVTGLRQSLRSAQNIKRNSEQIVDTIVAEDIGKLPDLTVSETAARIPGVTIIRRGGEADAVLVRGLPDFTTTYNGREIFTAETRVVALQDFPSSNIAALEVFKTPTANMVEAGLAGLVNVRSRRPFDFKDTEIAASAWALYTKQAGKWNPNFNALASTRWDTGIGEMGLLLNISRTELDYLDSEPSNTDFLQTFRQEGNRLIADFGNGTAARFPDIQRVFYRSGNRVRPSGNAAFQWRASDALQIYAEALYQGFRNKIDDRRFDVPLFNGGSYSNLQFREGTNLLESGSVTGLGDRIFSFQGGTFNKTDTYQFAVGAIYDAGPLKLTADLARTNSKFKGSTESVDRRLLRPENTTVNFDLRTPEFSVEGIDVTDPANWVFNGLFEQNQRAKGDDYQARLDGEYDLDISFLRNIQAGIRYTDRDAVRGFGQRFGGTPDLPLSIVPLDFEVFRRGFRGTDVQSGLDTWLAPTYESIRKNREELRAFIIAHPGCCDAGAFTLDPVAFDPVQGYRADEKTLAGYAQLNMGFGEDVEATVGIRGVRTKSNVAGTANVAGVLTPISFGNKYTDWLPNASLRWRATPELQLRLSYAQTRTRPQFSQLNPGGSLGSPDPLQGGLRTGTTGNPFLKPFTSNNYDASIEYYFSRNGFAALALFRKDLDGFIQPNTVNFTDPDLGPLRITGPVNTRKGRIQGVEAQMQTFFDWDWVPTFGRNFGVQANYTYIDGETEFFNPFTGQFEKGAIVFPEDPPPDLGGLSKHTYNLVGMYEGGGFSARLSYNKRGKFLDRRDFRGPGGAGGVGNPERDIYKEVGRPAPRLDLSTSYTINDNFTLFFDWTNILEKPLKTDFSSGRNGADRAEYVRFLRYEETTFSLGIRARM